MSDDGFKTLVRDVYKLFSIWPKIDDATVIKFAADQFSVKLKQSDIIQFRQACGLENQRFSQLGRVIVYWRVATELSTFGYAGRTKEKLCLSAVQACEQLIKGRFSTLLISEWVEDAYEELAPYAKQPMKIRVYATERAAELRELLGCHTLPKISSTA